MINTRDLDKTAISYKDERISYKLLFQYINNVAEIIDVKNAKIAIYADNSLEWIYAFYAAWMNDCIVIPIDAGASVDDVSYILQDCQADMLFTTEDLKAKLTDAGVTNISNCRLLKNLKYSNIRDDFNTEFPAENEKTAVIIYTSGTTGKPKGVMLSFENILINIKAVTEDVKIITTETLLLLPLHHVLPLVGSLVAPLNYGTTVVVSPSMQSKHLMETFKNNKVGVMIGVPRLYELIYNGLKTKIFAKKIGRLMFAIAKRLGSRSFSKKIFKKVHDGLGGHINFMVCGGAALNTEVGNFYKTLGFEILEGYGMTEAAPMISFTRPGRVLVGSPGEILPGLEVKVVDNEIVVKGRNVMQGYYNKPEETAKTVKDGWLYTGDLGYVDDKGFLHITGRKKDIIVLPSGKNISPVEIELKLESEDDAIKEAAVFFYDNNLHAVVVPDFEYITKNGIADIQAYFKEEILPRFNEKLSSYKRVMQFSLINTELPRTKLGKIQRFKLADMIDKTKAKKNIPEVTSEEGNIIKRFIEQETSQKISLNDHIEYDIAMDSLGKLSLIDFIEKTFGVVVNEQELLGFANVGALVEYVEKNKVWQRLEAENWTDILKERVNISLPRSHVSMLIIKYISKIFFKLYFNFKGEGYKKLPPGPCIIAPNHQSFFDGLFVISFIRNRTMLSTYFYAKKKHVNNRILQFAARWNNIIVVDLQNGLKESIQKLAEVLKTGKKIIIFPEGTRTHNGELGEFKKMFAILSKELNVPVVPVAINGAYKALPRGAKIPRPFTKIKVRFLEAVYPRDYSHENIINKTHKIIGSQLSD